MKENNNQPATTVTTGGSDMGNFVVVEPAECYNSKKNLSNNQLDTMTRANATSNAVEMALVSFQGCGGGIGNICGHEASIYSNRSSKKVIKIAT